MRRAIWLAAAVMLASLAVGGVAWAATITGTSGPDTLRGTTGNDTIDGKQGNDVIEGMDGADDILGGNDDDELYGGRQDGNNVGGGDVVRGQEGYDIIYGGTGSDLLYGGTQDDFLYGLAASSDQSGADKLYGEFGNDTLIGSQGRDELRGGPDDDTITDGLPSDAKNDVIYGEDGNDKITSFNVPEAKDTISCGTGNDTVYADSLDQVSQDCENVTINPAFGSLTFTDGVTLNDVQVLEQEYDSEASQIGSEFLVGGELVQELSSTLIANSPVSDVVEEYSDAREEYLQQTIIDIEQMVPADRDKLVFTKGEAEAALANVDDEVVVTTVMLSGDLEDIERLESGSALRSSSTIPATSELTVTTPREMVESEANETHAPGPPSDSTPTSTAQAVRPTFYPNEGYSRMRQSWDYPNRRFTGQYYGWYANTLGHDDTYEHDVFLNNLDRRTYLINKDDAGCYPEGVRFFTTAPDGSKPYVDTNYQRPGSCLQDYRAYTIGFLDAGYFRDGVLYQNYLRTPFGNKDKDLMSVQAQVGYRSGCAITARAFCSYGTARTNVFGTLGVNMARVPTPGESFYKWTE